MSAKFLIRQTPVFGSSKGQAQIIQFILFFIIGLALFLMIGGAFSDRLVFFSDNISEDNRMLLNSYFSALSVNELVSCRGCDGVNISVRLFETTGGSFTRVELNNTRLTTATEPGEEEYSSNMHNLMGSLSGASGIVGSPNPIILSYSKSSNTLRLLQVNRTRR